MDFPGACKPATMKGMQPPQGGTPPWPPADRPGQQGYPAPQQGYPAPQAGYPAPQAGYPPPPGYQPPQTGYPPTSYPPPPQQGYPPPEGFPPPQAGPPAYVPSAPSASAGGQVPPPPGQGVPRALRDRGALAVGLFVAGIGLLLLLAQYTPTAGQWIPLAVGLIFLAVFFSRREYGFLVPGSIITGVGVGILLVEIIGEPWSGAVMLFAIAGGFIGIWVIGALLRLKENHWWPFIPGGIMALVGMVQVAEEAGGGEVRWWPIVIIVIGLLIIVGALRRRSA